MMVIQGLSNTTIVHQAVNNIDIREENVGSYPSGDPSVTLTIRDPDYLQALNNGALGSDNAARLASVTSISITLEGQLRAIRRNGSNVQGYTVTVNDDGTIDISIANALRPVGDDPSVDVRLTYNQAAYTETITNTRIYPADRCAWNDVPSSDGRGYTIADAIFYTGGTQPGANNTVNPLTISIEEAVLGYIGKSGRFVPITDRH